MKKFELTNNTKVVFGRKMFKIKALIDFGDVKSGEFGGYVEKEENLSQDGNAWIYENAKVFGDAKVFGNAEVFGDAKVFGNAEVCEDAKVFGNAEVCGDAWICGDAKVYGSTDYTYVHGFGSEY